MGLRQGLGFLEQYPLGLRIISRKMEQIMLQRNKDKVEDLVDSSCSDPSAPLPDLDKIRQRGRVGVDPPKVAMEAIRLVGEKPTLPTLTPNPLTLNP